MGARPTGAQAVGASAATTSGERTTAPWDGCSEASHWPRSPMAAGRPVSGHVYP